MAIALDNFVDRPLSHICLQLGFYIDRRAMRVYLLQAKMYELLRQLDMMGIQWKAILPLEAAALLGILG